MRRGLRDGIGSRRLEVGSGGGLSPEEVGSVPKRWGLSPRKEIGRCVDRWLGRARYFAIISWYVTGMEYSVERAHLQLLRKAVG